MDYHQPKPRAKSPPAGCCRSGVATSTSPSPTRSGSRVVGPEGFTSTTETCNFQQAGHWRFVFHGQDGKNYPNHNISADPAGAPRRDPA